jgi:uncharacterized protein
MVRFSGEERFPVPRSRLGEKFAHAAFLASCVRDAEPIAADSDTASWRAKSRFSFVTAKIESELTIVGRSVPDTVSFTLSNRMPGATLGVNGTLAFFDEPPDGARLEWSAEIVSRTGLLKIVPFGVLRTQIEAELTELWHGVRVRLAQEFP